jgi:hypothetical protein
LNNISGNRALLSLNVSNNNLVGKKGTGRFTTKTYDSDGDTDDEAEEIMEPDFSGVIALANVIPDMGALSMLNLSSNCLQTAGVKSITDAMKVIGRVAS